jgi:hypothetical protein
MCCRFSGGLLISEDTDETPDELVGRTDKRDAISLNGSCCSSSELLDSLGSIRCRFSRSLCISEDTDETPDALVGISFGLTEGGDDGHLFSTV